MPLLLAYFRRSEFVLKNVLLLEAISPAYLQLNRKHGVQSSSKTKVDCKAAPESKKDPGNAGKKVSAFLGEANK